MSYNANQPRVPAGQPGGGEWEGQYNKIADEHIAKAEAAVQSGKTQTADFKTPGLSDGRQAYGGHHEHTRSAHNIAEDHLRTGLSKIDEVARHYPMGSEAQKAQIPALDTISKAAERLGIRGI